MVGKRKGQKFKRTDSGDARMRSFARQVSYTAAPAGTVHPYAGSVLPDGYLWCRGGTFSQADYPNLYAALGNSTTLPDYRGRALIGAEQGPGLSNRTLGATGGEETHVITDNEMSAHNHGSVADHHHTAYANQAANSTPSGGSFNVVRNLLDAPGNGTTNGTTTDSGGHGHSTVGTGAPHNNMQPWAAVNYIIRT